MAARIRLCAAMLAATALGACGGGGGGGSDDGPTSGLANPGDITGASADWINTQARELAIINSPVVRAGRTELPVGGSASYAGSGSIFDSSITTADNTAARLQGRAVVTDVVGNATFGANPSLNITQSNFRDVVGSSVPGSAIWTTNYVGDGLFEATVTGNVGGTTFATGTSQARVGFFGNASNSAITGVFSNAEVTASGTLQGSAISGDFAATGP
jgi:hypothetical protein